VFFERDAPPNLRTGEAEVVGGATAPNTNHSPILSTSGT
jgi:hypothetical protein